MEFASSFPYSQQPTIFPYREPDQSSPCHRMPLLKIHFSIMFPISDCKKNNHKKLYIILSCLGVFTFCTCCKILICLVCFVASFKLSCVCCYLMCIIVLCVYCCFYFRCRTAGQKSVFGRSCDRPPRHRFFLASLCLKANAEMVPKFPSRHYMLFMQPSRLKFSSNEFHVLFTCKITTATG